MRDITRHQITSTIKSGYVDRLRANHIYFAGLLVLAAALPVSLYVTSLAQFILIGSFIIEGELKEKFKRFFSNRAAVLLAGIWILHVIGLLWTEHLDEGIKDIRIKLPLIILPLVVAGNRPLSGKRFNIVLLTFVLSVFCASMISMSVLVGVIQRNIYDIRDVFIFNISHIRFSLFVCLAIYILIWLAFFERNGIAIWKKISVIVLSAWFLLFLVIVESVTGLLIFSITGLILLLIHAFNTVSIKSKILISVTAFVLPVIFILVLKRIVKDFNQSHPYPIVYTDLTPSGRTYFFDLNNKLYENGYPVWMYLCEEELGPAWNNLSDIKYDSLDERKQQIKFTLVRFLTSKGMRKDSASVYQLSPKERRSIERGIANVNYQEISSLHARLLQIMWEFDQFIKGGNPSGHSVTQRFEFWKAAMEISSDNILIGVGTGDMPAAYQQQYLEMKSSLDEKHRLRAHNQYLAILVAFGIPGLIYFLCAIFFPMFYYRHQTGFMFVTFFLIMILSMFSEDTLETQAGATFVGFFFSVLLFGKAILKTDKGLQIS